MGFSGKFSLKPIHWTKLVTIRGMSHQVGLAEMVIHVSTAMSETTHMDGWNPTHVW